MKKSIVSTLTLAVSAASAFAQTTVSSNVTADTTWNLAGSPYILESTIFVNNNATLTIDPGVIVRGQPRTASTLPGALVITQSGSIIANGNAGNPIIFTTAAIDVDADDVADDDGAVTPALVKWTGSEAFLDDDPANTPLSALDGNGDANVSLWGGLIILGNAPTNVGTTGDAAVSNPQAQVSHIEGLTKTTDTRYGGSFANDNSGILRYVSVRHGGDEIGTANEINGITLGGVGAGTTMEYCEVYMNFDDGFEFFGGTINTNHLVVTFAGDDQFDGDQGWTGKNQFWFGVLPYFTVGSKNGDKGFEFDGDDGLAFDGISLNTDTNSDLSAVTSPYSDYEVYNATLIGNASATGNSVSANGRIALKSRFSGTIANGYFVNLGDQAGISDGGTFEVTVVNSTFGVATATNVTDTNTALGGFTTSGNFVGTTYTVVGGDQATASGLNPRPQLGFPLTPFQTDLTVPAGYEQVSYRGAFDTDGSKDLWTKGWTVLNKQGILVD
jgi:hypothetical protein